MVVVAIFSAYVAMRVAIHGREVEVPQLANLPLSEAAAKAAALGLRFNIENRFYSAVPAGEVISQSPAPGTTVRREWTIRVTESLGPQQISIPSFLGQTERLTATIAIRARLSLDLGVVAHIPAPGPRRESFSPRPQRPAPPEPPASTALASACSSAPRSPAPNPIQNPTPPPTPNLRTAPQPMTRNPPPDSSCRHWSGLTLARRCSPRHRRPPPHRQRRRTRPTPRCTTLDANHPRPGHLESHKYCRHLAISHHQPTIFCHTHNHACRPPQPPSSAPTPPAACPLHLTADQSSRESPAAGQHVYPGDAVKISFAHP